MSEPAADVLPRAGQLILEGIEQRLHRGMQVYVSRDFVPLADFALGWNGDDDPLSADHLLPWLSAGKPVTALAVLQLAARGLVDVEGPVAEVIPEFAAAGKEGVTVQHLLIHTGGLKPVATGWPHLETEEIVSRICAAPLRHGATAGSHAAYDPARSWFVLGEIVRRRDGRPVEEYVRQEILLPLEMQDSWLALPEGEFSRYGRRLGFTYTTTSGTAEPTKSHLWETCRQPSPGGSMRGPIRELGWFYEMLLRGGSTREGHSLLPAAWLQSMMQRQREGKFDETFQHVVDIGWGVLINSNRYGPETIPYGFGRHAGEQAVGHGGAQSAIGFMDPENQLVVAAVANGMPGEEAHNRRFREILTAVYEDLELAG